MQFGNRSVLAIQRKSGMIKRLREAACVKNKLNIRIAVWKGIQNSMFQVRTGGLQADMPNLATALKAQRTH